MLKKLYRKLEIIQISFGNPGRIIMDRGAVFTSNEFKEYYEKERNQHLTITTGVPRGNGHQVERVHQVVMSVLANLSINKQSEWYKHVGRV